MYASANPMTATKMPMMSHIRWPVMKLPGSVPVPCRIQTPPTRMAITPTTRLPIRIRLDYAVAWHASLAEFNSANEPPDERAT